MATVAEFFKMKYGHSGSQVLNFSNGHSGQNFQNVVRPQWLKNFKML